MNNFKTISQKHIYWIILLLIITFSVIIRIRLLDVPLQRDEGGYAYTAQLMLQGIPPYLKAYSMRLPGLHVAYALIISLFGHTQQGIHIGLLIVNSITILFVCLLSRFFLSKTSSLVSAATFALLSITDSVQGFAANSEHFVILFVTIGLYLLLLAIKTEKLKFLFYSGFILSIGVFMKQNGLFFIVLSIVYLIYYSTNKFKKTWILFLINIFTFLLGVILFTGCSLLIIYYIGIFNEFWFWTFEYARKYITQVNLFEVLYTFSTHFKVVISSGTLLWLWVFLGLFFLFIKIKTVKFSFFLILFCLFSFLSICPGFYFRTQYFILLLPCAGILSGLAVDSTANLFTFRSKKQIGYYTSIIFFTICILQTIYVQRDYLFSFDNFQVSRKVYEINPFNESLKIAEFLNKHTSNNDTIAILGSEPQIYFYSKRHSASGFIHMYPMMEKHRFSLAMQKIFINDIDKLKPKYIVFIYIQTSWLKKSYSHQKIFKYFDYLINNNKYNLCGLVEIYNTKSLFYWKPDKIVIPPKFSNWIGIYERSN